MASDIRVDCKLTDCIFFRRHENEPRAAFCGHKDKKYYMENLTCPLFKIGWNQNAEQDLIARFAKQR